MHTEELEYVGFWPRVGATIIDTLLLIMLTWPLLTLIYGEQYWYSEVYFHGTADLFLSWVFPALAAILFWIKKQATPGKMAVGAIIVDAQTGNAPTTCQCIGRYFAYIVAMLPLGLGLLWVAFDKRKQGWHDKLSGTVVIRKKNRTTPVSFQQ